MAIVKRYAGIFLIIFIGLLLINVLANNSEKTPIAYTPSIQWVKITKSYIDFSTPGASNNILVYTILPKQVVHQVYLKANTTFSGGTIASYTVSVGVSGSFDQFILPSDVNAAPTSTLYYGSETYPSILNFSTSSAIRANAISVGGNLNAATSGSLDIYLAISTLP